MKKVFLWLLSGVVAVLGIVYTAFLFYLPKAVDLNAFLPDLAKLVRKSAHLKLTVENPQIVTTPLLQAGIKTGRIVVKLPDNSELLTSDGIDLRVSIPKLLFLNVSVPKAEINGLKADFDIADGEQFKLVQVFEEILTEQQANVSTKVETTDPTTEWLVSHIKINVPKAVVKHYNISINDLKTRHHLKLKGEELELAYRNGKTAKVKTGAKLFSDDKVNITANLDIDTVLPEFTTGMKERDFDDPAEKVKLPFVNPVLMYRDYDLKSDIDAKLKVRKHQDKPLSLNGHVNIEGATLKLAGLQLPKSFFRSEFRTHVAAVDSDIYFAQNEGLKFDAQLAYGKNPFLNLKMLSDKIYFNDMITLTKALFDSFHITNNFSEISGNGYWKANASIKTDFKKLTSNGCIIARDGRISNRFAGSVFDKINANILFENNAITIKDTGLFINNKAVNAEGTIDGDAYTDIKISSDELPLKNLFTSLAPNPIRNSYRIDNGGLKLDVRVFGELKKMFLSASAIVTNLNFRDVQNNFVLNNEKFVASVVGDTSDFNVKLSNKGFGVLLPATRSTISDDLLVVNIDKKDLELTPTQISVNSSSKIELSGNVKNYSSNPKILLNAGGFLNALDMRRFLGSDVEPYFSASGNLPIKLRVYGTLKKIYLLAQVKSDANNYLTPVNIQSTIGKQSILQAKFDYNGEKFHIKNTGLYTGARNEFSDELSSNMSGTTPVAKLNGTIVNLNTKNPYINQIKFSLPKEIQTSLTVFPKSTMAISGDATVFGKLSNPLLRGDLNVRRVSIPEILTRVERANLSLAGKDIVLRVRRLLLNGSDFDISARTDINPHPKFMLSGVDVKSSFIDVDKLMAVAEALDKNLSKPATSNVSASKTPASADIPAEITSGSINMRKIKTGAIVADNTTGRISLKNNVFYLDNLRTHAFDGVITGKVSANLINNALTIQTNGQNLDVDKTLVATANLKDTLSGDLNFNTDISLQGVTMEEQMRTLKGRVSFVIKDGQLGPFGKLENMILAENIRESKFFETALGGVINSIATLDTTHFSQMIGHLTFSEGIANINPITTKGNVLSLHIAGDMNLLTNNADMKVRAKLGSMISNALGPIAQVNPVNLVKVTPGLNVVMAQAFAIFCEQVTPEEMAILPKLSGSDDDMATKFQIVLRGDVNKPLKLVKSFKWLALSTDIENAQNFVSTLPDPSIIDDPQNATIEAILQAQQELAEQQAEIKAKEDAKITNRIKRLFIKKAE